MNIGRRIKAYRQYLNMTQEILAGKANLNDKYYGRIERGESCPTINTVEKICEALEIEIVELFLFDFSKSNRDFTLNQPVVETIIDGLENDIDIHFNRDAIMRDCYSSIWYSGYVGSMSFDEFELAIYACGNIKGTLVINYNIVLEINSNDVTNELSKYVFSDMELLRLIEYSSYDEQIVKERDGNVFFLVESNWFSARLINNSNGEIVQDEIVLDSDSIIQVMKSKEAFFDYIFNMQNGSDILLE